MTSSIETCSNPRRLKSTLALSTIFARVLCSCSAVYGIVCARSCDLRVRWALDEAGLAYEEVLIGPDDQRSASYRKLQPFGQVPAYEEDGLVLFDSGAIVMHVAERSPALMPEDPAGRARTKAWMFAALSSIEPTILHFGQLAFQPADQVPDALRRSSRDLVKSRLGALSDWLGDREWLEDRFTAGDLLMTTVLRMLRRSKMLADHPRLEAYRSRCEARPAFQKALAAHMAPFERNAPNAASSASP